MAGRNKKFTFFTTEDKPLETSAKVLFTLTPPNAYGRRARRFTPYVFETLDFQAGEIAEKSIQWHNSRRLKRIVNGRIEDGPASPEIKAGSYIELTPNGEWCINPFLNSPDEKIVALNSTASEVDLVLGSMVKVEDSPEEFNPCVLLRRLRSMEGVATEVPAYFQAYVAREQTRREQLSGDIARWECLFSVGRNVNSLHVDSFPDNTYWHVWFDSSNKLQLSKVERAPPYISPPTGFYQQQNIKLKGRKKIIRTFWNKVTTTYTTTITSIEESEESWVLESITDASQPPLPMTPPGGELGNFHQVKVTNTGGKTLKTEIRRREKSPTFTVTTKKLDKSTDTWTPENRIETSQVPPLDNPAAFVDAPDGSDIDVSTGIPGVESVGEKLVIDPTGKKSIVRRIIDKIKKLFTTKIAKLDPKTGSWEPEPDINIPLLPPDDSHNTPNHQDPEIEVVDDDIEQPPGKQKRRVRKVYIKRTSTYVTVTTVWDEDLESWIVESTDVAEDGPSPTTDDGGDTSGSSTPSESKSAREKPQKRPSKPIGSPIEDQPIDTVAQSPRLPKTIESPTIPAKDSDTDGPPKVSHRKHSTPLSPDPISTQRRIPASSPPTPQPTGRDPVPTRPDLKSTGQSVNPKTTPPGSHQSPTASPRDTSSIPPVDSPQKFTPDSPLPRTSPTSGKRREPRDDSQSPVATRNPPDVPFPRTDSPKQDIARPRPPSYPSTSDRERSPSRTRPPALRPTTPSTADDSGTSSGLETEDDPTNPRQDPLHPPPEKQDPRQRSTTKSAPQPNDVGPSIHDIHDPPMDGSSPPMPKIPSTTPHIPKRGTNQGGSPIVDVSDVGQSSKIADSPTLPTPSSPSPPSDPADRNPAPKPTSGTADSDQDSGSLTDSSDPGKEPNLPSRPSRSHEDGSTEVRSRQKASSSPSRTEPSRKVPKNVPPSSHPRMSPVPQGYTESPASSSIRDPVPEVPKSSPMGVHSSGGSDSDDLGSVNTGKQRHIRQRQKVIEQKNPRATERRTSFEESSESSVEDIHGPGSGSIETPPSSRQSEGPKSSFAPRKDSSAGGGSPTEPPLANIPSVRPGSAASSGSADCTAPLAPPKSPLPPDQIGTNPAPSRKLSLPYESVGKHIAPSKGQTQQRQKVVNKGDTRTTETQRTSTETSPSVENIHDHEPDSSSPKTPHGSSSRQDYKSLSILTKRPDTEDDSPPELPDVSPVRPAGPTSPDARLVPPKSPNEPLTSPGNNSANTADEPSVKPIVTMGDKSKMPSGSSGEHIRITRETTISLKIRSLWDSKSQKLKTETLVHDLNTGSWETLQNYEVHSEQPPYIGTEGVTEDGQGSKLLRHIEEAYEISNDTMGRIMMCSKNLEEYSECTSHSESIERPQNMSAARPNIATPSASSSQFDSPPIETSTVDTSTNDLMQGDRSKRKSSSLQRAHLSRLSSSKTVHSTDNIKGKESTARSNVIYQSSQPTVGTSDHGNSPEGKKSASTLGRLTQKFLHPTRNRKRSTSSLANIDTTSQEGQKDGPQADTTLKDGTSSVHRTESASTGASQGRRLISENNHESTKEFETRSEPQYNEWNEPLPDGRVIHHRKATTRTDVTHQKEVVKETIEESYASTSEGGDDGEEES